MRGQKKARPKSGSNTFGPKAKSARSGRKAGSAKHSLQNLANHAPADKLLNPKAPPVALAKEKTGQTIAPGAQF
jgi:hypothetical protein